MTTAGICANLVSVKKNLPSGWPITVKLGVMLRVSLMIEFFRSLYFKLFRNRQLSLYATSKWSVTWADIGVKETGQWMYFVSPRGKRYVEPTNVPCLLSRSDLPGYAACTIWRNGGPLPDSARRVKDE